MFDMTQSMYELYRDLFKRHIDDRFIGRHGEQMSYEAVKRIRQFRHGAKILRNLYIPKGDGGTTEIDLLVLTKKGVFVFETKNVLGDIIGDERDEYWMVTVGEKQRQLYNPVRQNAVHIRALKESISVPHSVFSVVLFSERANLRDIDIYTPNTIVTRRDRLQGIISGNWRGMTNYFDKDTIEDWYQTLLPYANASKETKMQHNADVRRKSI